jgi:MFS family permease
MAPLPAVGGGGSQEVGGALETAQVAVELAAPAVATSPQAPAPARGGGRFFAPLRVAGFRLLIGGQTISRLGDQFFVIAIPWLVLRVTQAPFALALVLGASAVTTGLFTLVGGVLADRLGPRALMLGSDVARFVLMAALAALAILTTPPLWALIVISALLGIGTGLFYPASQAMVPFLVPREDLQAANSFEQLTMQSSNFVGPGLAGLLLGATQLAFGFVVDAASFAVSVVSLVFVRVARRPGREAEERPAAQGGLAGGLADLGEAFRFLGRTPFLLTLLGLSLLGNFALQGMFEVALPLLLKQMVGVADGPRALGIIVSGFGLGSILGVIAAGVAHGIRHKPLVGILLIMPQIGLMAWIPFVGSVYGIAGLFAATGLLLGASNVLFITVIQRFIPIEMMGRMMSIALLGSFVGGPLSIFAYGAVASLVPQIAWLFIGGAALLAVGGGLALTNRQFWVTE